MHVNSNRQSAAVRQGLHRRILVLWLLLSLGSTVFAEAPYLRPGHPEGVALLPPPPVPGSPEAMADLAEARAVFSGRTRAEEARAEKDDSLSLWLFTPTIGPWFQPGKCPKTEALWHAVKKDIAVAINTPKDHWKRLRPYQLDPHLNLGPPEKSYGYPSGHSTRGTVYAAVLAELLPEKKEPILAIGRDIGWDRVLIGKHFPTDIYAGRVLGKAIVRELMASPAFQHDLAEAKAELTSLSVAAAHPSAAEVPEPAASR
jgi:acid phosphatase (class A)